jgi:excisionase family DNA binding protein
MPTKTDTPTSPWLTLEEAATYAKLSTASITRARKSRALTGYKVQGKKLWRFNVTDIDRWLQAGGGR